MHDYVETSFASEMRLQYVLLIILLRDIRFARRFGPLAIPHLFLDFFVFNPWDLYYHGYKLKFKIIIIIIITVLITIVVKPLRRTTS